MEYVGKHREEEESLEEFVRRSMADMRRDAEFEQATAWERAEIAEANQ